MVDLIIRPSGIDEPKSKWSFQLRYHDCIGKTEYRTLCRVDDITAREIIRAGVASWLFGDPDKKNRREERDDERSNY